MKIINEENVTVISKSHLNQEFVLFLCEIKIKLNVKEVGSAHAVLSYI